MISSLAIVGAGLALGAAGSGHCGVMCGPLVLLSQPRVARAGRLSAHITAYHAGRLLMYAVLGVTMGAAGGWIAGRGFGRALAAIAIAALLVQAIWQWRGRPVHSWPALTRAVGSAGRFMRRHTVAGPVLFGALTGLLPCGLIYAALTAAIGLGGPLNGALLMVGFAAGSVPVLAAIGVSAKLLQRGRAAQVFGRLAPTGLVIVALLIAFRASGMHAGHSPSHSESSHAHHH